MLFHPDRAERLARLSDRLCAADEANTDLISAIFYEASDPVAAAAYKLKIMHLSKLIDAGAWTEVALAVLEMELPHWKLRRPVYDDSEWHCALSLHRELPDWLDDSIEAGHRDLSLAIWRALVEALRADITTADEPRPPTEERPRLRSARREVSPLNLVNTDNFF